MIDGDTIVIGAAHLRLVGIDTPESDQTCAGPGDLPYPCGAVAARALAGFIGPEPVNCTRDGEDVYHRILATCFVRGEDIQRWVVAQGHALAFTRYSQAYASEEAQAQAAGRGGECGGLRRAPVGLPALCTGGRCAGNLLANGRGFQLPGPTRPAGREQDRASPERSPSSECQIKGNLNQAGERIYHLPSSLDYEDRDVSRSPGNDGSTTRPRRALPAFSSWAAASSR